MNINRLFRFLPFVIVAGALFYLFFPIFKGLVPVPLDALAGTYYPWLDFKWGYPAGVPVKNIAVSDVFSQLYPWRTLSLEAWRQGFLPLWNPYSFSGTPLLGNWQSAPFYPGNLLMFIFGDLWGWSLMVLLQPLLALTFTYLYLRQVKLKPVAAITGGFIFAFSGFMTTYLTYNTTGQILIWLPLLLFLSEKYLAGRKIIYLSLVSLTVAIVALAGFFQPALYVYLVFAGYFLFRSLEEKKSITTLALGAVFIALGLALAAVQLLPTLELLGLSIRSLDANIFEYKFGLLPPENLLTLFAPDYFGNPVTFNFTGFMQYQETAGYFGISSLVLILSSLVSGKRTRLRNFFALVFFASLVLAFRNPLSQLVYDWQLPAVSTGYASRWLMLTGFSAAVLAAFGLDSDNRANFMKSSLLIAIAGGILIAYSYGIKYLTTHPMDTFSPDAEKLVTAANVSFRNSIYPFAIAGLVMVLSFGLRKSRYLPLLLLLVIIFDLTRFSHKFTPFAPVEMASNDMPVTNFLRENIGHFRVEKEPGPILPSNTWINFRLMSPSGYDPLVVKEYGSWHRVYNSAGTEEEFDPSKLSEGNFTRYLERTNYQSPFIDLAGVKYLLMLKRDQDGIIYAEGDQLYYSFLEEDYDRVFEYVTVVVFENPRVIERVSLWDSVQVEPNYLDALGRLHSGFDFHQQLLLEASPSSKLETSDTDRVEIVNYQANQVDIESKTSNPTVMMLTDTYFPGWKAYINDQETRVLRANGIYRAIELPAGENSISFVYQPESFRQGSLVSLGAILTLALVNLIYPRIKPRRQK